MAKITETKQTRHTPGPWRGHNNGDGTMRGIYGEAPYGNMICYMTNPVPSNHEGAANARLIASAPALLQALEKLYVAIVDAAWEQKYQALNGLEAVVVAEAAIKEARGD